MEPLKSTVMGAAAAALVLTTTALAGSGVGGVFNLGQVNTVDAQTSLNGNPAGNPLLKVTSTGTAAAVRGVAVNGIGTNGVSTSGVGQQGLLAARKRCVSAVPDTRDVPVPELSLTEERIVLLLAEGRSTREIAADVGLDERTVDWHLARAARKLEQASALHRHVSAQRGNAVGVGTQACPTLFNRDEATASL